MTISAPVLRWVALLVGPLLLLGASVWIHNPSEQSRAAPAPYAEHPPLAHTGGFGEPTCHACHFGGEVNGGDGTLAIKGLPATVRPGRSFRLTVTLSVAMKRAGFMLSVRTREGKQAGRLTSVDTTRVGIGTPDTTAVQYAHHTLAGTKLTAPDRAAWSVRWTVPKAMGDTAVVHVAANAANDDASEFGDDVYTATKRVGIEK